MTTITHPNITISLGDKRHTRSFISKFFSWCEGQQHNRLLWLGVVLVAHGCIFTPVTVMTVVLAGSNLVLFMAAITAMGMTLVTNLAALPTKVTIPVFLFSIILDIVIIIVAAFEGFDITKTYI